MIITGYQGIGKSTLARKTDKIIDLESTSFWKYERDEYGKKTDKKTRCNDWYVYYCQVAEHLSAQGYTVFVSCHAEVRKYLALHTTEKFCAIFPDPKIKDDWLKRLEDRYNNSKSDKDLRAWEHAKNSFDNDIQTLINECWYSNEYYNNVVFIDDINYDLQELIDRL